MGAGPALARRRAAYGIVKTRTDGERLLIYTDSGNVKMKEAYAFGLADASQLPFL